MSGAGRTTLQDSISGAGSGVDMKVGLNQRVNAFFSRYVLGHYEAHSCGDPIG